MWDPVSWALSFTATRIATRVLSLFGADSLTRSLNDAATRWAETLPKELSANAGHTLLGFFGDRVGSSETGERARLASEIEAGRLPSADLWRNALMEQWLERRHSLGDTANAFFAASKDIAEPYVNKLADQLYRASCADEAKWRVTIMEKLEQLHEHVRAARVLDRIGRERADSRNGQATDGPSPTDAYWRIQRLLEEGYGATRRVSTDPLVNGSPHDVLVEGNPPSSGELFDLTKSNLIDFYFVDERRPSWWIRRGLVRVARNLRRDRASHHHSTLLVIAPNEWLLANTSVLTDDFKEALPVKPQGRNHIRFLSIEDAATINARQAVERVG